jgi:hypothetical protein
VIRVAAFVMALILATPAFADETESIADATLAKVRPGPPLYLYSEPRIERGRAYVIAGDTLVVTGRKGGFAHVEFVNAKGRGQSGYVLAARLEAVPTRNVPSASWIGEWNQFEARITIAATKPPGRLLASGHATFGMHDPERVKRGAVHFGDFDAVFVPRDDQAAFGTGEEGDAGGTPFRTLDGRMATVFAYGNSEGRCGIRLRVLEPYLLVDDNDQCGGLNVTFRGTYRRSAAR